MADQMQAVRDDIAFMRALAQEGRSAPLLGGSIMVAAGVIFGGMTFIGWLIAKQILVVGGTWAGPTLNLGSIALFLATMAVLRARIRGKAGLRSPGNRATNIAWAGVGCAIMVLVTCAYVLTWRLRDPNAFVLLPPTIFVLYGAGWMVAAAFSGKRWLWLTALASYAAAIGMAFLMPSYNALLGFSVVFVLLTVPQGLALMRQEPTDVV